MDTITAARITARKPIALGPYFALRELLLFRQHPETV